MSISVKKYSFTQDNVDKSPTKKGVYALYEENVIIYIGKGDGENGIRGRLQAHKRGDEGSCTKNASHYRREVCSNPTTKEKELLQEYKNAKGKLPRCNELML
jgi:excinuclease UvrABC nuclease subunit